MNKLFVLLIVAITLGVTTNIMPSKAEYITGSQISLEENGYKIDVFPTTLGSSGWVYFNITSKNNNDINDILFAFGNVGTVTRLQLYDNYYHPELILVDGKYITQYDKESGNWFNYTQKNWEWSNSTYFDWKEISISSVETKKYFNVDQWYLFESISIQKDVTHKFRAYIEIPFAGLNKISGEYYIGLKSSKKDLSSSIKDKSITMIDPWWDSNWKNRSWVVVNPTNITAALTGVPLLVQLPAEVLAGSHGYYDDIRFVDLDNTTLLPYEIEAYSRTDPTQCAIWVNFTTIKAFEETCFWCYFNNSLATSVQDSTKVWDQYYAGVWHMNDSTCIWDSTSNRHYDTGALCDGSDTAGKLGNATHFDAGGDYYLFGDVCDVGTDNFVLEGMWSTNAIDGSGRRFAGKYDGPPGYYLNPQNAANRWMYLECYDGSSELYIISGASATWENDGNWHYTFGVKMSTNLGMLANDIPRQLAFGTGTAGPLGSLSNAIDFTIGQCAGGNWPHGNIDEVRISIGTARNDSWINTTYHNMNQTSKFFNWTSPAEGTPTYPEVITQYNSKGNNTNECPCDVYLTATINMSNGSRFNITFYIKLQNDTNYGIAENMTNISPNITVYFCLHTYFNDVYYTHPMRYNNTYYWFYNATKFNYPTIYNQSDIYYFSTYADPSSCTSSGTTYIYGGIGVIGLAGLFGFIISMRRRRYYY